MNAALIEVLDIDKAGDWDKAHSLVQKIEGVAASRIHAYLHREEGDLDNADYWYARAGTKMPTGTLDEEWTELRNAVR